MKLSQLSTNAAADALLLVVPEIETLLNDDALVEKFAARKTAINTAEGAKLGLLLALGVASHLLNVHREPTLRILGALNQKTPEEIGSQLLPVTIAQIAETLQDEELLSFFPQRGKSEPVTSSES